jgi:hypothetical protein
MRAMLVFMLCLNASPVSAATSVNKNDEMQSKSSGTNKKLESRLSPSASKAADIQAAPNADSENSKKQNDLNNVTYKVDIVTPPKDTPLFGTYLWLTGIGVFVNGAIWFMIWRQTRQSVIATKATAEAAGAAKRSAEVAKETIDVYKLTMRPWLYETISLPGNQQIPKGKYIVGVLFHGLDLTISNEVPHPAWVTQVAARFHCVPSLNDLPRTPEFLKDNLTVYSGRGMIVTRDAPPIKLFVKSDTGSASDFGEAMYKKQWIACIYGLIKYRGMFDGPDEIHETGFLYASEDPVTWERSTYPPAYTKHT